MPNFLTNANLKIILFGGKGGSGKTTSATATALHLAQTTKKKILIVSTDPAPSIGDSLDLAVGNKITQIRENLWALEIVAQELLEDFRKNNWEKIKALILRGTYLAEEDMEAFENLALPGMDEIMAVININIETKTVRTNDGSIYPYDLLINTIPLPICVSLIQHCPKPIQKSASLLNYTGIYVLNIGFKTNEFVKGLNWCYFPEKEFDFYRLGIASNTSNKLSPNGFSTCYIEFNEKVFRKSTEDEIYEKTIHQLVQLGILNKKEDIIFKKFVYIQYAYVIFDKKYQLATATIQSYLQKNGIYSIGRFGGWEYSYIEKNITDARELSETISNKILSKPIFGKH